MLGLVGSSSVDEALSRRESHPGDRHAVFQPKCPWLEYRKIIYLVSYGSGIVVIFDCAGGVDGADGAGACAGVADGDGGFTRSAQSAFAADSDAGWVGDVWRGDAGDSVCVSRSGAGTSGRNPGGSDAGSGGFVLFNAHIFQINNTYQRMFRRRQGKSAMQFSNGVNDMYVVGAHFLC